MCIVQNPIINHIFLPDNTIPLRRSLRLRLLVLLPPLLPVGFSRRVIVIPNIGIEIMLLSCYRPKPAQERVQKKVCELVAVGALLLGWCQWVLVDRHDAVTHPHHPDNQPPSHSPTHPPTHHTPRCPLTDTLPHTHTCTHQNIVSCACTQLSHTDRQKLK